MITALEFNIYMFVLDEAEVKYYILGETEAEGGFGINYVYDFSTTSFLKKSALERIATVRK